MEVLHLSAFLVIGMFQQCHPLNILKSLSYFFLEEGDTIWILSIICRSEPKATNCILCMCISHSKKGERQGCQFPVLTQMFKENLTKLVHAQNKTQRTLSPHRIYHQQAIPHHSECTGTATRAHWNAFQSHASRAGPRVSVEAAGGWHKTSSLDSGDSAPHFGSAVTQLFACDPSHCRLYLCLKWT